MASPSSGDDYYASLGNEPAQTSGGSEKKKIIKIVAKKAVAHSEPVSPKAESSQNTPIDTTPISNHVEVHEPIQIVDIIPEEQPYISRTVKLPESGTLDLGGKFSAGPAVVFHTQNTLPKPLGSNKMRSSAPLTRGQGQGSSSGASRSPFRPVGSGTPGQSGGNRPQ
ncbi:MAG: hypothetical protein WCK88_03045 [bacterium]